MTVPRESWVRAEMRFELASGRPALFAKLQAVGVGQISRIARAGAV